MHTVSRQDYSAEQLDAWAPRHVDEAAWDQSFQEHDTIVAWKDNRIVGFGDIRADGYLDRLYVHALYQRQGIGTAICRYLENTYAGTIRTDASITAKGFFLQRGYHVIKAQEVERRGVTMKNFRMEKIRWIRHIV